MELKTSILLLVVRQFGNVAPLKIRYGGATGVSTGRGGATDLHGYAVCSGVNSSQSIAGKVGGN